MTNRPTLHTAGPSRANCICWWWPHTPDYKWAWVLRSLVFIDAHSFWVYTRAAHSWLNFTRTYQASQPVVLFPCEQASTIPWKTLWHEIRSCGCVPSSPWIFVDPYLLSLQSTVPLAKGNNNFRDPIAPATESSILSRKTANRVGWLDLFISSSRGTSNQISIQLPNHSIDVFCHKDFISTIIQSTIHNCSKLCFGIVYLLECIQLNSSVSVFVLGLT